MFRRQRSHSSCRLALASLALGLAFAASGCGESGPEMATVTGKVTYKGQPLTKGSVSFVSTDPQRASANGTIGPDGSYSLQTREPGDGAEVGAYQVAISGKDPNEMNNELPGAPVKITSDLPAKFEDPAQSGQTATVKSGKNAIDFNLTD